MGARDSEYVSRLKRFHKSQSAFLATLDRDLKHAEQEIAAKSEQLKAIRLYRTALRAEYRAERSIFTKSLKQLAEVQREEARRNA